MSISQKERDALDNVSRRAQKLVASGAGRLSHAELPGLALARGSAKSGSFIFWAENRLL